MNITNETFQQTFIEAIRRITNNPDHICSSRIGMMREKLTFSYRVTDPTTYKFEDDKIGRIDYDYASTFYSWMISGSTDAKEAFKQYPNVAKFLDKPKNENLPANFNTFYGPRILAQLPRVKKELSEQENSRRAVISILQPSDLELLGLDESLEFPCTDNFTLNIRDGKLHGHLQMRSQNMANVLKLDMYLWGRLFNELAKELNVKVGNFDSTIVSAHVFNKDFDYLEEIGIL